MGHDPRQGGRFDGAFVGVSGEDPADQVGARTALERPFASEHFIKHAPEAEDIRARIRRLAASLFGRHVRRRAHDYADAGGGSLGGASTGPGFMSRGDLGQAEIQNFDAAVFGDEQVVGLDVAVGDALAVRRGETGSDLFAVVHGPADAQFSGLQAAAERFAFQKLHHDVGRLIGRADVVNSEDVGVVQTARRLGLQPEAPQPVLVRGERRRKDFDCDFAVEARVARLVHFAHATGAKVREDFVRAESRSRSKEHYERF